MRRQRIVMGVAALVMASAIGTAVRAQDNGKNKSAAVTHATVQFAMVQPQPPGAGVPGSPDNVSTHFLNPDDVTIIKGGTVTFVVNGGGHGIAIHEVNNKTTRADIAAGLCDGNNNETGPGNEVADRIARSIACNGTKATGVVINGTPVVGTNNLNYIVRDAKGDIIIEPGFNVVIPGTPPTVVVDNPRLDDPASSPRLLATSGASPGDKLSPKAIGENRAGAFVNGTTATAPGNRFEVQFTRTGRYLVICMNRAHAINDHMFGFVNVVGGDGDEK